MQQPCRLLVKLRPQTPLGASDRRANLRPLFDTTPPSALGLTADSPAWYVADAPDMGSTGRDAAHGRVGEALGIGDSAVLFVEPDLAQSYPDQNEANVGGNPFSIKEPECTFHDQDYDTRPPGPGFAWHLRDEY